MEQPVDQLKTFALESQPDLREVLGLDLEAYWRAVRDGTPVPLFAPLTKDRKINFRVQRRLRAHQVAHVLASPLSPEFYEAAHGVQAIIVRDLRRRHALGQLIRS